MCIFLTDRGRLGLDSRYMTARGQRNYLLKKFQNNRLIILFVSGRYVGSRPIKLRKSSWKQRNLESVRKKEKEKQALIGLLTGR